MKKLFVGNLPYAANETDLQNFFAEQGVPGFDLSLFVAAYAPAGTPPEIVGRLQQEIRIAIAQPAIAEKMIAQGQTPVGSTPAAAMALMSANPVSSPMGAAPARQSLMPLYCAGLCDAVNIAPGASSLPDA